MQTQRVNSLILLGLVVLLTVNVNSYDIGLNPSQFIKPQSKLNLFEKDSTKFNAPFVSLED